MVELVDNVRATAYDIAVSILYSLLCVINLSHHLANTAISILPKYIFLFQNQIYKQHKAKELTSKF